MQQLDKNANNLLRNITPSIFLNLGDNELYIFTRIRRTDRLAFSFWLVCPGIVCWIMKRFVWHKYIHLKVKQGTVGKFNFWNRGLQEREWRVLKQNALFAIINLIVWLLNTTLSSLSNKLWLDLKFCNTHHNDQSLCQGQLWHTWKVINCAIVLLMLQFFQQCAFMNLIIKKRHRF